MRRPVTGLFVSAFAIPMVFLGSEKDGQRDNVSTEPDVEAPPGPGSFASRTQLPDPAFARADGAANQTDLDFGNRTVSKRLDAVQFAQDNTGQTGPGAAVLVTGEPAFDVDHGVAEALSSSPSQAEDLPAMPSATPENVVQTKVLISQPLPDESATALAAVNPPEAVAATSLARLQSPTPDRATVWDAALVIDLQTPTGQADLSVPMVDSRPLNLEDKPTPVAAIAPVIALAGVRPAGQQANEITGIPGVAAGLEFLAPQPAFSVARKNVSAAQKMFTLARLDRNSSPGFRDKGPAVPGLPILATTSAPMIAVKPLVSKADRLPLPAFGQARTQLETLSSVDAAMGISQPDRVQTLQDALRQSYSGNPRLLAERANLRSADYDYTAARSVYGPRLDAFATLAYTYDQSETLPGSFLRNQGWTQTAGLILNQPLLIFGRGAANEGQATATVEFRRASLRITQDRIALDVISAYVGSLREAGALTIARENVRLLQQELADGQVRFDLKDITATDLHQVEARLALGQSVLLEAKARLSREQALFYSAVGVAPGELAQPERLDLPFRSISEAYAAADVESPLIWAAKAREKVSRAQLAAADAERRPSVSFRGTADYAPLTDYSSDLHAKRLRGQITLSIPVIDGGKRSSEISKAQEANQADWRLIDASMRDTRTDVATSWNRLLAAQQSVEYYQTAVRSANEAFEGAKVQERASLRTTLEVLDLARDLLNVRNGYNQALTEEYLARASILYAVGRLNPELLVPDLERYDPDRHFEKIRRNADIPLLTGLLSGLDDLASADLRSDRPSRDSAALIATGAFAPEP